MQIEEIKKLIPHRYPFLLVDRVLEIDGDKIVTIKNVSVNDPFFQGHFPGAPIMPGVLQVEALAQSGCILMMQNKAEGQENNLIVFTGINNAKFRRQVVPGDVLKMEVELVSQRRNFINMKGIASVEGEISCQLDASAAIVPREK